MPRIFNHLVIRYSRLRLRHCRKRAGHQQRQAKFAPARFHRNSRVYFGGLPYYGPIRPGKAAELQSRQVTEVCRGLLSDYRKTRCSGRLFVSRFLLFRWETFLCRNQLEHLRRGHGEPIRELEKAGKRYCLLSALYSSYLVTVKVTLLRKLLLREMPFNP